MTGWPASPDPSATRDIVAVLLERGVLDPPPHPGLLAGLEGYGILRLLGEGAMGVVLLARESAHDSLVAIKMIRPELIGSERQVARFLKEVQHLSRLRHPNVLPVLGVIDRSRSPAFVVPYIDGENLGRRIAGRPMRASQAITVARALATALQAAHHGGITHRDLKPANVLIDSEGRVFLCDFGLSRSVFNDPAVDPRHVPLEGTVCYLAPELARGEAGDTRCDIYSWGALLYEMLAGQPPYSGSSTQLVIEQVKSGPPTPIRSRNPKVTRAVAGIVETAMARELRDRYASFADVLAALAAQRTTRTSDRKAGIFWR